MCKSAGCFLPCEPGKRFCAKHSREQAAYEQVQAERMKASSADRFKRWEQSPSRWVYRDARWAKARREQLRAYPACKMCGGRATDVDHIIPHMGREEFAFNPDNLQSLCHACHVSKTRSDKANDKH